MSTLLQLRTNTRIILDDTSTIDQLWSDDELDSYFNYAENEACKRAHLLIDSTTGSIVTIPIILGTAIYALSNKVLEVRRAMVTGGTRPLIQTTKRILDLTHPSWESDSGTIRNFFIEDTNKLTLYKKPSASGTLNLTVSRLPITAMSADDDTPEIDEKYHEGLIDGALHRAYMKQDSETLDVDKAKIYEKKFTERFGPKLPAIMQRDKKK